MVRSPPAYGIKRSRLALLLTGIGLVAAAPGIAWYFFLRRFGLLLKRMHLE